MTRVFHLHVVRTYRDWRLQDAQARSLAVSSDMDAAMQTARERAQDYQRRGMSARVLLHRPGRKPEVFDFPAFVSSASVESYALSRCRLC